MDQLAVVWRGEPSQAGRVDVVQLRVPAVSDPQAVQWLMADAAQSSLLGEFGAHKGSVEREGREKDCKIQLMRHSHGEKESAEIWALRQGSVLLGKGWPHESVPAACASLPESKIVPTSLRVPSLTSYVTLKRKQETVQGEASKNKRSVGCWEP